LISIAVLILYNRLRLAYIASAIQAFLAHPILGLGAGGWPIFYGETRVFSYPHNMVLEIASETGLLGLCVLVSFLGRLARPLSIRIFCKEKLASVSYLLLLFAGFNALKSGDINDSTLFFVACGLVAGVSRSTKLQDIV
jgi:O-antigen ligase